MLQLHDKEKEMSLCYEYYLGLLDIRTNKIDTLGVYDCDGLIHPVLNLYSSNTTLYMKFSKICCNMFTDRAKSDLGLTNETNVSFAYLDSLKESNYIKSGYFLIDDIDEYEKSDGDPFGLFEDYLTPVSYIAKKENGCDVSMYSYYAYPDYYCDAYDIDYILRVYDTISEFKKFDKSIIQPVVILIMC